jgi:hypothetical protein
VLTAQFAAVIVAAVIVAAVIVIDRLVPGRSG